MLPTHKLHINGQRGFTLLEVLIALLILSIGLLGLAALQTISLRSNEMASMRTAATHLAYDITDRMRANPGRTAPDDPPYFGVADQEYLLAAGTPPTATDSVAENDLVEWYTEVARLPGGRASITQCGACAEPTYTITVQWNESRNPNATVNNNCPPVNNTDLRCFSLVYSE